MSLTSYRAAPPRAKDKAARKSRQRSRHSKRNSSAFGRPGNDLLSQVLRHSTIGAEAFDGRVRDGIGSYHFAKATRPAKGRRLKQMVSIGSSHGAEKLRDFSGHDVRNDEHRLMRAIKPIERLVPVSSTHHCASTPGLSTWSSSTALKGELVSRWVSRLDAFSGYPVRT